MCSLVSAPRQGLSVKTPKNVAFNVCKVQEEGTAEGMKALKVVILVILLWFVD